jgi:hypothetical protein
MSGNQKQHKAKTQAQVNIKSRKPEQKISKNTNPEQMMAAPETLRSDDILAAQQQVGNQVVQRALDDHVRGKKGLTDSEGNLRNDLNDEIQKKRGGGSPLPDSIRKEASKKLGRSFKDVRIHTDDNADKLSRSISARAFTIGSDIFFKGGVFSPGSSAGRETLIHELTHVVQQNAGGKRSGGKLKLGAPDTSMEKEAAHMGKKHASSAGSTPSSQAAVQRESEEEEIQLQRDVNAVIQREGEEEEIQAQSDTTGAVVQRQGRLDDELKLAHEKMELGSSSHQRKLNALETEREAKSKQNFQNEEINVGIQRQSDSNAIQAQPDTAAVVQRSLEDELKDAVQKRNEPKRQKQIEKNIAKTERRTANRSAGFAEQARQQSIPTPPPVAPPQLAGPAKDPKQALKDQIAKTKKEKEDSAATDKSNQENLEAHSGISTVKPEYADHEKHPDLIGKAAFDPKAAKKEAAKANKAEQKKASKEAKKEAAEKKKMDARMKLAVNNPKKLAKQDAKAAAKEKKAKDKAEAKSEKAGANGSDLKSATEEKKAGEKGGKVKSFFKGVGGALAGYAKNKALGHVKEIGKHYAPGITDALEEKYNSHKEDKEKEKAEAKAAAKEEAKEARKDQRAQTIAAGNGGGGGGGSIDKIIELSQQNERLKMQIEKLEEEKKKAAEKQPVEEKQ